MKLIHRCQNGVEANVILIALSQAGINAFEGEQGTSSIYPLPNFGPAIYVSTEEANKAIQIIQQLTLEGEFAKENETFYDADPKEIEYLKSLNEEREFSPWIWIMTFIIIAFGLAFLFL